MKKRIIEYVKIISIMLIVLYISGKVGYMETHYTREATVIGVDNDIVSVCDTVGYEWRFQGTGFKNGDIVKMKMFTMGTDDTVFDDEIEDITVVK